MVDPQSVRKAVADAGFTVDDFLEMPGLPTPMAVWQPFILVSATPTVRIPYADPDADVRVDNEWWRLCVHNGTLGADGTMLLAVEGAGQLPWLRVRVGDPRPRASAVRLPEEAGGFVALSPDGRASTYVSSEEWETWIFASPTPSADTSA
ncbi:hypothetical protein [Plantactinospora sp. B5E13]|uniref:hypothetical protein n=1 Tax=unclassified Plantactinospora TaxID=2631981 RepID=UPI00325E03C3